MDDFTPEHDCEPDHETVMDEELFADEAASGFDHVSHGSIGDECETAFGRRDLQSGKRLKPSAIRVGQVLAGKYRVERIHAPGALGTTIEARHLHLQQRVALKLSNADCRAFPERGARFLSSARSLAQLRSEHVPRVIDMGTLETGTPYSVVEHLAGTDLRGVLQVREWLPPSVAIGYLLQACAGVAKAHVSGLVHRNLKPSNLFLARDPGGRAVIKVLDFALVEGALSESSLVLSSTSTLIESLAYLAPEQIRQPNQVDARADIWALGAILHEMLTGFPVYAATSAPGLFAAIAADPPIPIRQLRPQLSAELEAVVLRCLEKDPQARYPDLGTLARQLRPFIAPQARDIVDQIIMVLERRTRSAARAGTAQAKREPRAGARSVPLAPVAPAPRRSLELGLAALAVIGLSVGVAAFIAVHNLQNVLAMRATLEHPVVASLSPALPAPAPAIAAPALTSEGLAMPVIAPPASVPALRPLDARPPAPVHHAARLQATAPASDNERAGTSDAGVSTETSTQALFENPN